MNEQENDVLGGVLDGTAPTVRERNLAAPERRDAQVEGCCWPYRLAEDGGAEILGLPSPEPAGELAIPSQLDGHPVTAIPAGVECVGVGAFSRCDEMTSAVVPEGVTVLGDDAFEFCTELTTLTLPKSLCTISLDATYGCSKLKKVRVASGDAQRIRELFEAEASADVNIDFEYEEK